MRETEIEQIKEDSILSEQDMKSVIERRGVAEDDFYIIEELASFPKEYFLDMHNSFSGDQSSVVNRLNGDIMNADGYRERFLELLLELTNKYGKHTSYNINIVFERRDRSKFVKRDEFEDQ
jgi:hypothetical protein